MIPPILVNYNKQYKQFISMDKGVMYKKHYITIVCNRYMKT